MTAHVAVVGGGPAGLTAAIYTARAGLDTTVYDAGEPILARNAHLENVPGFPAGVNARTFLDATRQQAENAGVEFVEAHVERVTDTDNGFVVETDDAGTDAADFVVAASWPDSSYLDGFELSRIDRGSKTMLDVDEFGRTDLDGIYAAGRVARQYHQAVVAAGHGATVGLTVIDDSDVPHYHDWVAPEGYFTGRDRDVPPGCEEIDEAERRERERASLDALAALSPVEPPTMHPSVEDDD
ncbi:MULTISPECIES: NAD(P)/FAD-dependent oxidoreductase [unclassified Halobacterium]|uniref:FAD-dependent oxidoreductase n=1 Tax=Halobacterium sp. NMX12-1 TaxID=3166650 RepID=A0AAU8C8L4_9EURY|nr:NAD(P)/FAD-dependent oxidoreductase [Halobacterium sp. KA-6]MCD2202295.1 FAD-dependent oxidoreductase [Halobacterium sp. KA-6]